MKAIILAGGLGTRISEETTLKPKPMIEIGGMPILWHIMKMYSHHGINDFIICCGYKGHVIKEYFANYFLYMSDVTFDMTHNKMEIHQRFAEPWRVTLVDTGDDTKTGGRLKRVSMYLEDDEDFCFTYGDGVSDLNITELIKFHRLHRRQATLAAVNPPNRFGVLEIDPDGCVFSFKEKPQNQDSFINGGFFVLSQKVVDLIAGDETSWEEGPLEILAQSGQLKAFVHDGFWQSMDTLREKNLLERLWKSGEAPWMVW